MRIQNLSHTSPLMRILPTLTGRRILLLQAPIGLFFKRLACDLQRNGNIVSKINFNGGDWFFFRDGESYKGEISELSHYLRNIILTREIDLIFMFSDCRPIHAIACEVARELQVETGIFEEGYIRPNHITLERSGVNAYSQTTLLSEISNSETTIAHKYVPVENDFGNKIRYAFIYFLFGILGQVIFRKYKHHKAFIPRQLIWWSRSAIRKQLARPKDRSFMCRFKNGEFEDYFFVALQVYDDFQVVTHSDYEDVRDFIEEVISSFIHNAPLESHLVIKHHPMDRGYRDYGVFISNLVRGTTAEGYVHYQHEVDLVAVIERAKGTVVINSTVGLDAIYRGCPTCVTGRSFYNIPGLVYEGTIDDFWRNSQDFLPDPHKVRMLRNNILLKTQINGSFYTPFSVGSQCDTVFAGLNFPDSKT